MSQACIFICISKCLIRKCLSTCNFILVSFSFIFPLKLWHEDQEWAVLLNPKKYSTRVRTNQYNHLCVRSFNSTVRAKQGSDEEHWLHRCIVRLIDDLRSIRNPSHGNESDEIEDTVCLLYTSPSPRDLSTSRMPSSA